jgi:hypothetical protein
MRPRGKVKRNDVVFADAIEAIVFSPSPDGPTIEREHTVVAAVEVYEFAGRAEAETTRVGDSAILGERSGQRTVSGETEDRAVARHRSLRWRC